MYSTHVARTIAAPRAAVYRALVDPVAIARWRVPDGMRSSVHEYDARPGGRFRISLRYDAPDATGKTAGNTDTYSGHFAELVPDERVVEVLAFETADGSLGAPMTLRTSLVDTEGGTEVIIAHEGVPDDVSPQDNEAGTRMALARLAALVEAEPWAGARRM